MRSTLVGLVFSTLLCVAGLLLHGCDESARRHAPVRGDEVLAEVNGARITVDDFRTALSGAVPEGLDARRAALDKIIQDKLISMHALHRGFGATPEVKGMMVLYFANIMPEVLRADVAKSIEVTDDELPLETIADTPIITLSQIIVPTLDEAEQAKALLDDGEEFGKVARERSKGISAQGGGMIGQIDLLSDIYSPGVKAVINKLKPGETSPITKTDMGYAIFRVEDRIEPDVVRRRAVEKLRQEMKTKMLEERMAGLIQELRAESDIKYNEKLLSGDTSQDWGVMVDGMKITLAEGLLNQGEIGTHTPHGDFNPMSVRYSLDKMVDNILMYKESVRRGLDSDPDIDRAARIKLDQLIASNYINTTLGPFVPTPQEIKEYYDKYKDRFARATIVRMGRVLTASEEDAKKAMGELESGADFGGVADRWSVDKSKLRGGDTGWVVLDDLVEPVKSAVSRLNVGDRTPIIKTSYGYEIYVLAGREEGGVPDMSEIMGKLTKKVSLQKRSEAVEALYRDVYKAAKIMVNDDLLSAL